MSWKAANFRKIFPFSFRAEGREGGEGERDKEEEKITARLFIPGRRWGGERDVGFLFAACCLGVLYVHRTCLSFQHKRFENKSARNVADLMRETARVEQTSLGACSPASGQGRTIGNAEERSRRGGFIS